jgi:signal transduction histidine kinase
MEEPTQLSTPAEVSVNSARRQGATGSWLTTYLANFTTRLAVAIAALIAAVCLPLTVMLWRFGAPRGAIVAALIAAAGIGGALVLAKWLGDPLAELTRRAAALASGQADGRIDAHGADEIGRLAASFNALAERVERSRAVMEEHSRTMEQKIFYRTERLEALNRELREANRLNSEFLATVSHELRTPLHVILGYCEMLGDGGAGEVNDEQRQMLASIQQYSKLQLDLITNVLDFSRLASGNISFHVERFALPALLSDIRALYESRYDHAALRFDIAVAPDVPELTTDRIKVQEVVRNLVDNAIKFTPAGAITLAAHANAGGSSVVVEVRDTGPGISEEELGYIFDAFRQVGQSSTRRTTGVGLGLSIVKQLVEALGGAVSVDSRVGEGSTFRVEVPCRLPERKA